MFPFLLSVLLFLILLLPAAACGHASAVGTVRNLLTVRRTLTFRWNGDPYRIQEDNNKGCDYLSLWREGDFPCCLGRALFDIMVGIDDDAVSELMELPVFDGRSMLDRWPEIEFIKESES